jgi:hypothetical protein
MRFKAEYKQERTTLPALGDIPATVIEEWRTWSEYFPAESISEALAKAESYNTSGLIRVVSIREVS